MRSEEFGDFDGGVTPDALPSPQEIPSEITPETGRSVTPVVGSMRLSRRETRDFQLRANGKNRLMEAAMPLMGLVIRIRRLSKFEKVDALHSRLVNEVEIFQQDIEGLGYDEATVLAARYVLCSAIDEAVLSQPWGAESNWPERPLLSVYHNETWGGEKVFTILDRVMDESHRFVDLLEFIYYTVSIGFEGKYHVVHNGHVRLENLLSTIHERLTRHRGAPPDRLLEPEPNIYNLDQRMNWRLPVWAVGFGAVLLLIIMHIAFDQSLDRQIDTVRAEIERTLGMDQSEASR